MDTTGARVSLVVPRLDTKPWGGRKLEIYGLDLPPDEPVGEALVTAGEAVVTAGDGAGSTLSELVATDPAGRLGERAMRVVGGRRIFPLLVKLIDAAENLSIQVHPDDEGAASLGRLGKTEAWHVLSAEPGGTLYLGLKDDVSLDTFMADARKLDGSSERALRSIEAKQGMTVVIPAGTIHALGAGVMVYEIQQPSDVTFRLDDWGRTDKAGNPRETHLEQGYRASMEEMRPREITGIAIGQDLVSRVLLAACRYFALERIHIPAGKSMELGSDGSPEVLTALSGDMVVQGDADDVRLQAGSSVVIWPTPELVALRARTDVDVLRAWVPDLERDIVAPARAAGADDPTISALGGGTDDVRELLAHHVDGPT